MDLTEAQSAFHRAQAKRAEAVRAALEAETEVAAAFAKMIQVSENVRKGAHKGRRP